MLLVCNFDGDFMFNKGSKSVNDRLTHSELSLRIRACQFNVLPCEFSKNDANARVAAMFFLP